MKLLWMLFWEFVFVLFVLPWAWLPIVLDLWGNDLFTVELLNNPETDVAALNFIETPPLLPIQKTLSLKQVYLL